MNNGIKPELCSLSYSSVEEASMTCSHALVTKTDLKNAYQMVPVHVENRHLVALKWKGETFVDGALAFGLGSAPKIFAVVIDALSYPSV